MATIISIINNKGGTGKTTTAINFGTALCRLGYKILFIDLDSQANLSHAFGIHTPEKHIGDLMLGKCSLGECMLPVETMQLIPACAQLLDYEFMINNEPGRELILKEILSQTNEFDYIITDCPPSLGTMSINSLVAAHFFIVPMQAENFAFIGLDRILQTADKVKQRMNTSLELAGILMIKYQTRTRFGQAVVTNIASNHALKDKLFDAYIRQDVSLMEAPAFGQSVFAYDPSSRGTFDYLNVAKEFIKKYGNQKN